MNHIQFTPNFKWLLHIFVWNVVASSLFAQSNILIDKMCTGYARPFVHHPNMIKSFESLLVSALCQPISKAIHLHRKDHQSCIVFLSECIFKMSISSMLIEMAHPHRQIKTTGLSARLIQNIRGSPH